FSPLSPSSFSLAGADCIPTARNHAEARLIEASLIFIGDITFRGRWASKHYLKAFLVRDRQDACPAESLLEFRCRWKVLAPARSLEEAGSGVGQRSMDFIEAVAEAGISQGREVDGSVSTAIETRMHLGLGARSFGVELHGVGFHPHDGADVRGQKRVRN